MVQSYKIRNTKSFPPKGEISMISVQELKQELLLHSKLHGFLKICDSLIINHPTKTAISRQHSLRQFRTSGSWAQDIPGTFLSAGTA